ncbi:hypothetical protein D0Z00_002966 [Geotrichum galactomycetum]|uniref:Uncharacterized protein n=1 Tax=Geotrichum galactomycetum TaxID=27317 RepID=A0ACB6V2M5_9ASCO|nr:hypothetical protein D0Z00_002966 [Geotrichum candidum]
MSAPVVPAWKKLGLKVKEDIRKDPLTGQVQAIPINNKSAATNDTTNKNKRPADNNNNDDDKGDKTKKPPKRVKLPKAERKAPPESDNLVYLRQYHTDKNNWKFSKQKQNWILKNVYEIEADYVDHLLAYLKGLQGGARERVTQESFEVITHWNEYMKAPVEPEETEPVEAEDEKKEENTTTTDETTKDNTDEKATKKANKKEEAPPPPPTEPKARRAQTIFNVLTGNLVPLELLEEEATTTIPDPAAPTTTEPSVAEQETLESEEPEKKTKEKKDKKNIKEKKDKASKKSHK